MKYTFVARWKFMLIVWPFELSKLCRPTLRVWSRSIPFQLRKWEGTAVASTQTRNSTFGGAGPYTRQFETSAVSHVKCAHGCPLNAIGSDE